MKQFHFFPSLVTFIWLLSACQIPPSANTGASFALPSIFCNGRMAWSAEITTADMVDYSTFWIAFEAATVQDNFQHIQVDVTLDGKPVTEEMKYMQAAEPYSVSCPENSQQFEASRLKYTVLLPLLSKGEHVIRWIYTLTADLDDSVFDYPSGMTAEYPITIPIDR